MGSVHAGSALRNLQRLFGTGTLSGTAEGGLLERFVLERDEAAFEAILARHGPMVVGVCKRHLNDPHDVEDAFQATFLVLVRRARAIRDKDLLGPWLYGVARRVAVRARATSARRAQRERSGVVEPAVDPRPDVEWRDLAPILDEEVARLPERFRTPVVLCDLQGLTHEDAARQLGCPVGTLKSRLSRARERLRGRLTRRGVAPSAGFVGAVAAVRTASASVPPALVESTLRLARGVLAGTPLAASVSTPVVLLMKGALATMFVAKLLKVAAWGLLASCLIAGGVEVLAQLGPPQAPKPGQEAGPPPPDAPGKASAPRPADEPTVDRPTLKITSIRHEPSRGSPRALEARLRAALQKLSYQERLHQTGAVDLLTIEATRAEVGVLKAQIETEQDDLRDELERLNALLDVKKAELEVFRARQAQATVEVEYMQQLSRRNQSASNLQNLSTAQNQARIQESQTAVKLAEIREVEVQIGQVQRRLARYQPLVKKFLDAEPEPKATPGGP